MKTKQLTGKLEGNISGRKKPDIMVCVVNNYYKEPPCLVFFPESFDTLATAKYYLPIKKTTSPVSTVTKLEPG